MKNDLRPLAEGIIVSADPKETGMNNNQLIIGSTGSGKTFSVVLPTILNTYNSSLVVTLTKGKLKKQVENALLKRGYTSETIDLSNPKNCTVGFDPLDYFKSEAEMRSLAQKVVSYERNGADSYTYDPYWEKSAANVLFALIELETLNAKEGKRKPSFVNVLKLADHLQPVNDPRDSYISYNYDMYFEQMANDYPEFSAPAAWKSFSGNAEKTAACILACLRNAIALFASESVMETMNKKKKIDIAKLEKQKTVLFLITSPVDTSLQAFCNLIYGTLFKVLFETAEKKESMQLDIPVHILCDDFACGCKIPDFEKYISVFRAAGISVTILLQSRTQLEAIYGAYGATTIIDNCDTQICFPSQDLSTLKNIAERLNKSINSVSAFPNESVVVFRRGEKPRIARRYQTLNDPEYQRMEKSNGGNNYDK